jgi:hypothetical protein
MLVVMTDTDIQSKLAEYEGIIRMLTAKLEELAVENDRLKAGVDAHARLRAIYLDPDAPRSDRIRAASASLVHEKPRLLPEKAAIDVACEEIVEPLAVVVERQRRRADAMQREGCDIEVSPAGVVRVLPKPDSNGSSD